MLTNQFNVSTETKTVERRQTFVIIVDSSLITVVVITRLQTTHVQRPANHVHLTRMNIHHYSHN